MTFRNQPQMMDKSNEGKIRRWVHTPVTQEHYGIHFKIQENGKVVISKVCDDQTTPGEIEWDEIEVPASLIFKIQLLLKATRQETWVNVSEAKPEELNKN